MRFAGGMRFDVGRFTVETVLPHTLIVSSASVTHRYSNRDLGEGTEIVTWQGRRCGVVMGLESGTAIILDEKTVESCAVERLERLRLTGYDPGGLTWVEFYDVEGGDILLATEVGVSRINPHGRIVWQKVHDDLTVRPTSIDEKAIWLEGEHSTFGYDLSNGHFVLSAGA